MTSILSIYCKHSILELITKLSNYNSSLENSVWKAFFNGLGRRFSDGRFVLYSYLQNAWMNIQWKWDSIYIYYTWKHLFKTFLRFWSGLLQNVKKIWNKWSWPLSDHVGPLSTHTSTTISGASTLRQRHTKYHMIKWQTNGSTILWRKLECSTHEIYL